MLVRGACCGTHCAATQLRSNNRSKSGLEGVCPAAHARPTPCASRHGQKGLAGSVPSLRLAWHAQRAAPAFFGAERSDGPCRAVQPPGAAPGAGCLRGEHARRSAHASWTDLPRLSERSAQRAVSSAAHPASATTQVCPVAQAKGSQTWGRLFFAYFLLAKQKKVSRPPGRTPGPHPQPRHYSQFHSC